MATEKKTTMPPRVLTTSAGRGPGPVRRGRREGLLRRDAGRDPERELHAQGRDLGQADAREPARQVNGLEVPAYATEGTTPGKIQGGSASTADTATEFVTVGGVRRPLLRGGLHIPISAPVPVAGDRGIGWEYACTAVASPGDPALVGRRYLVWSVPAKLYATARRLDVVEV
jgi:hypothetical protein